MMEWKHICIYNNKFRAMDSAEIDLNNANISVDE